MEKVYVAFEFMSYLFAYHLRCVAKIHIFFRFDSVPLNCGHHTSNKRCKHFLTIHQNYHNNMIVSNFNPKFAVSFESGAGFCSGLATKIKFNENLNRQICSLVSFAPLWWRHFIYQIILFVNESKFPWSLNTIDFIFITIMVLGISEFFSMEIVFSCVFSQKFS